MKHCTMLAGFVLLCLVLVATGCRFSLFQGDRSFQPLEKIPIPEGFTFAGDRKIDFDLSIHVPDDDGDPQPFKGPVLVIDPSNAEERLIATGFADDTGRAVFSAMVSDALTTLILRPQQTSGDGLFVCMDREIALTKTTTAVTLTMQPPSESWDGSTPAGSRISPTPVAKAMKPGRGARDAMFEVSTAGYRLLSSYTVATGLPSALLEKRPYTRYKQSFKRDVSFVFADGATVPQSWVDAGDQAAIVLSKPTGVRLTFASETTSRRNAIGYLVVKTGALPASAAAIQASDIVVAFPNASLSGSGGALYQGDAIALRNPDLTSANYGTTMFDAGTAIFFVLLSDAYSTGNLGSAGARYFSVARYNPESGAADKPHTAQLHYNRAPYNIASGNDKSFYLIGFEDSPRSPASGVTGDDDFNDVLLDVTLSDPTAASGNTLPELDDNSGIGDGDADSDGVADTWDEFDQDPLRAYKISYPSGAGRATALYEDLWPSLGDYDFNDLVVDFRLTAETGATGRVASLVGDFLVRAAGGELHSGLALSMAVPATSIASVTRSQAVAIEAPFAPGANGVEAEATSAVLPIFSSAHALFGATRLRQMVNTSLTEPYYPAVPLTVTANFTAGSSIQAATLVGTVPDIFLVGLLDMHDRVGMRKEIHRIGTKPTSRVDPYPFRLLDDRSPKPPADGLYYHDERGAPWALVIPYSLKYAQEGYQIAETYRYFSSWVYSGGVEYPEWYMYGRTGYADSTKLYLLEP